MKVVNVIIRGETPLLQGKFPVQETVLRQTGGVKRIGSVGMNDPRDLIYENGNGYYCPYTYIEGTLREAGAKFKAKGRITYKRILATLVAVEPGEIPMKTSGWEPLVHVALNRKVGRVAVISPRFNDWELDFQLRILEDSAIAPEKLREILEYAGKYEGIGAWRPNCFGKYGKFTVVKFDGVQ